MKFTSGIIGLLCVSSALLAVDATTARITYTTNKYEPPLNYITSPSLATSSSNGVMAALTAQSLLLTELTHEHQKRAAELTQKNQNDRAKWETDLATELQEKIARLQKSIGQASQTKGVVSDTDDQLVFVSTVESRLEQARQELAAAMESGSLLSMQIVTNKPPDDMASLVSALGENQKLVKEIQREQLDLELRKLEFRAILKAMQK